jgi:hypothetical protein
LFLAIYLIIYSPLFGFWFPKVTDPFLVGDFLRYFSPFYRYVFSSPTLFFPGGVVGEGPKSSLIIMNSFFQIARLKPKASKHVAKR